MNTTTRQRRTSSAGVMTTVVLMLSKRILLHMMWLVKVVLNWWHLSAAQIESEQVETIVLFCMCNEGRVMFVHDIEDLDACPHCSRLSKEEHWTVRQCIIAKWLEFMVCNECFGQMCLKAEEE
eukprot:15275941-Ditylum_brightwellii.AAC.1